MKSQVIIFPSASGKSQINFYQSLATSLNNKGYEASIIQPEGDPSIPENWYNQVHKIKNKFNAESILVAHSSGAYALLGYLSINPTPVKAIHLVASAWEETNIKTEDTEFVLKQAQNFKEIKFDFQAINYNTGFISLHYSRKDPVVPFEEAQFYNNFLERAIIINHSNQNHFRQSEFLELVDFILTQDKNLFTYVNGKKHKVELLDTSKLPLILPDVEDYLPSSEGRSPLSKTDWIKIKDDKGQIDGFHESDTMPNWAGSSWYYLRYCDPQNSTEFASQENLKYWLPVDHYFGGNEHTTLHLLYSRFWHRFLYNSGLVPTPEPYKKRTNGGLLLGPDGSKMSKSKGNVIDPKEKLDQFGADALRLYIAFMGPYDATVIWKEGGLKACKKLVDTIYQLSDRVDYLNELPSQKLDQIQASTDNDVDIVVDALIYRADGSIYAQKRSANRRIYPNQWDLAGGHVEQGETIIQALRRGIKEETGLELQKIEKVISSKDWIKPDGKKAKIISCLVKTKGDFENIEYEKTKNSEYTWVDWSNIEILKENKKPDSDNLVYNVVREALGVVRPQKYMIFDFDGVIADTWQNILDIYTQEKNIPAKEAAQLIVDHHTVTSNKKTYSGDQLESRRQTNLDYAEIMVSQGFELFTGFVEQIKSIPDTKIAIVSNNSREKIIEPYMQDLGLGCEIILGIEDHHSKEERIKIVCEKWGVDPNQILYYTDTNSDYFELEHLLDKDNIYACNWGWLGSENLKKAFASDKILYDYTDIHTTYTPTTADLTENSSFLEYLETKSLQEGKKININLIIINNNGQIFSQHRRKDRTYYPNCWEISVYGKVEEGENIYSAIKRELKEETGWDLATIKEFIGELDWQYTELTAKIPNTDPQRTFSFLVEVEGDLTNPEMEKEKVDQQRWITAANLDIFKNNEAVGETWSRELAKSVFDKYKALSLEFNPDDDPNLNKLLDTSKRAVIGLGVRNHEGKFLILKRSKQSNDPHRIDNWEFPGGKLEDGETITQNIERELAEETGLRLVNIYDYSDRFLDYYPEGFNEAYRILGVAIETEGQIKLNDAEHEEYKFVSLQELAEYIPPEDGYDLTKSTFELFENLPTKIEYESLYTSYHRYLQNITSQIEGLRNNVAVAEIMTFVNTLKTYKSIPKEIWTGFLQTIAPFAPFCSEELWYKIHGYSPKDLTNSIHLTNWPKYNAKFLVEDKVTMVVQVNGKIRAEFEIVKDSSEEEILKLAKQKVEKWITNKNLKFSKVIPNKMVTLAVS